MSNFYSKVQKFVTALIFSVLVVGGLVTSSTSAFAQTTTTGRVPDFKSQCVGGSSFCSSFGTPGSDTRTQLSGIITSVANFIIYVLAAVAVLFIVYGGFLYVTDNGDGASAGKGKKIVIQALIGLVIAFVSYTLVQLTTSFINGLNVGTVDGSTTSTLNK